MALFVALLGLAILAPAFPLLVIWLDRPTPEQAPARDRFVRQAAVAGSIGILPLGLLFTLAAYGDWIVLALIAALGAGYGAVFGVAVFRLRSLRHRRRPG